jgi:3',5'-cyclic AMP phosphodiesterase CpdA
MQITCMATNPSIRETSMIVRLTCAFVACLISGAMISGSILPTSVANGQTPESGQSNGTLRKTQRIDPAQLYQPGILPDRVVLTWNDDPRTTQSVTWRTSTEVVRGIAQIAVASHGPNMAKQASPVDAETTYLQTDNNEAHFHSLTFTDLTPGTLYAYRVGDGTNWSEWFQFRTAAADPEPFSFIYFGDAQNDLRSQWSRVVRQAYQDAPRAAFLLHAGDLVNVAEADAEWGEWFSAGGWLNAMIANVPVPGNHEQAKLPGGGRRLSHHWRASFCLPENGPPGLEETCYTFTYHNLRVIGLNSNERLEEQAEWMEKVLSENQSDWVICTFHHPIYSTGRGRDNPELRMLWKPIFDKYQVDMVLQGHDHNYGRTGLTVPNDLLEANELVLAVGAGSIAEKSEGSLGVTAEQNLATGIQVVETTVGTVYVVSVSGPKMYNINPHWFMRRLAEDTQLYQVIEISGSRLKFEARTATGALYDAFELHQRKGQVNQMIEFPVDIDQRLRMSAE